MNEQEFKASLPKIVCKPCEWYYEDDNKCVYHDSYEDCPMFNEVFEALIADGIGDVSELQKECESKEEAYNKCYIDYKYWKDKAKDYKHRAEVAERALMTVCTNVVKDEEDNLAVEPRARVLYRAYLKQAEKELAEEGKDD